jgi:hypothetical protein
LIHHQVEIISINVLGCDVKCGFSYFAYEVMAD